MSKRLFLIVPLLFVLAVSAVFAQGDTTVSTAEDPELGTYLTDAEGMTLYLFLSDEPNVSTCYDQCAENWAPFTAEQPLTLPEGVPGELAETERTDGTEQVTYNGWPLYYWMGDEQPGDTTGHGVGDVWFVVNPAELGQMAVPGAATPPQASPAATPEASRAANVVQVELTEFEIRMPRELPAGPTTFEVTNVGSIEHNFEVEGQGIEREFEENLQPGETKTMQVELQPRTYEVYCPVGDHAEMGMRFELTVTD